MEKHQVPVCYFPTTVVFVDDNRHFLQSLPLRLDHHHIVPKLFSDPHTALQFLTVDYQIEPFTSRCFRQTGEETGSFHSIEIDVNAIHQEIYNQNRFLELATLVVDYSMPGLNGLELCRRVRERNNRIKILLLTGEADEKLAVRAFNEGIIDKFLRKDTSDFHQEINAAIQELQYQYFQHLTELAFDGLINDPHSSLMCLRDPAYVKLFTDIVAKNKIVEYYLTDTWGSFLLLDFQGKPFWLAVKNEQGMEDAYQVAFHADESFPEPLLAAMKNREKILCQYENELCDNPAEAEKKLFPAQRFQGKETYYYALIKDPKAFDVDPDKILSCRNYLEKLAHEVDSK